MEIKNEPIEPTSEPTSEPTPLADDKKKYFDEIRDEMRESEKRLKAEILEELKNFYVEKEQKKNVETEQKSKQRNCRY